MTYRYCLKCKDVTKFNYEESTKHSQCLICGGYEAISRDTYYNIENELISLESKIKLTKAFIKEKQILLNEQENKLNFLKRCK